MDYHNPSYLVVVVGWCPVEITGHSDELHTTSCAVGLQVYFTQNVIVHLTIVSFLLCSRALKEIIYMRSYYCIQIHHEMFAIVRTECVARGVCEVNMSEQSIHNSNKSCNLFIQSNKVKSIYNTVFCIRSRESVKQLILLNVQTVAEKSRLMLVVGLYWVCI